MVIAVIIDGYDLGDHALEASAERAHGAHHLSDGLKAEFFFALVDMAEDAADLESGARLYVEGAFLAESCIDEGGADVAFGT